MPKSKTPPPPPVPDDILPTASRAIFGRLADGTIIRLRLHTDLTTTPGWNDAEEFTQLCESIETQGVISPLLIKPSGEMDQKTHAEWADVVDGRHRFQAYEIVQGWQRGPLPCVETDQPTQEIIIRTLVERRHASKGTRAYLVWPLMMPAVRPAGRPSKKLPTESGISTAALAARYGFSFDLFDQARQLHAVFATRKDLREQWEPGILAGDTSLGGALAGIAGKAATEGKARQDAPTLTLLGRSFKELGHRFSTDRWKAMPAADRTQAVNAAVECVLTWPADVQAQIRKAL